MLKGLDPLLHPDLLHLLASMGHGDELVIADANFPAASCAARLCRLDGASATQALGAILSLCPLDQYLSMPAAVMVVVDDSSAVPEIVQEFQTIINGVEGRQIEMERVERFAFYERARKAFAVVVTSEQRLYGNIILSKGVIAPDSDRTG